MSKEIKKVTVPGKPARPAVPAKQVEEIVVYCDICKGKVDISRDNHYGSGDHNCEICSRDICRRLKSNRQPTCYRVEDELFYDSYFYRYCIICAELRFNTYSEMHQEMTDRHEREEAAFLDMVKQHSLASDPKNFV